MKKRGFGAGRWNGFGGKLGEGETVEEAAKRELMEEAGIIPKNLEKVGELDFEFRGNSEILEVHVFRVEDYEGEPIESEEMRPMWFTIEEIPFHEMWADDIHWLPLFLEKKSFKGRFLFDENDQVLEKELAEIDILGLK